MTAISELTTNAAHNGLLSLDCTVSGRDCLCKQYVTQFSSSRETLSCQYTKQVLTLSLAQSCVFGYRQRLLRCNACKPHGSITEEDQSQRTTCSPTSELPLLAVMGNTGFRRVLCTGLALARLHSAGLQG